MRISLDITPHLVLQAEPVASGDKVDEVNWVAMRGFQDGKRIAKMK